MSDEFRRGPRRRGQALEDAIYRAALDELAEHSFDGLSIERIALRAGTGKSAIYRRWPSKLDLVVATLAHAFPPPGPASTSGSLRTDLIRFHQRWAEALGGALGAALLANVGQHRQYPELAECLAASRAAALNLRRLVNLGLTRTTDGTWALA